MPQREYKGDREEHHNGDGNQNAQGQLLHLLNVAILCMGHRQDEECGEWWGEDETCQPWVCIG